MLKLRRMLPAPRRSSGPARARRGCSSPVSPIQRHALAAEVAEYFFTVRVGSGTYDQIGVHRVVKETAPNVPAHASRAVFLAPGDIWNFRAAFEGRPTRSRCSSPRTASTSGGSTTAGPSCRRA